MSDNLILSKSICISLLEMIEQIKKINNPLTIIAIFAALAEVNATIAIGLIDKELHNIFIWFIIGFPTILVILFFVTLNYNTKVMYSPSDYREDKTFLDLLYGSQLNKKIPENSVSSEKLDKVLSEFETKISQSFSEKIARTATKSISGDEIKKIIDDYKSEIKVLSKEAIQESSTIDFPIPPLLKTAIVNWISFPAFLPIVYAIIQENCKSESELKEVEEKYSLAKRWNKSGLGKLLESGVLIGNNESFEINKDIKEPLEKWLHINSKVITELINYYSDNSENRSKPSEKTKFIAQKLII